MGLQTERSSKRAPLKIFQTQNAVLSFSLLGPDGDTGSPARRSKPSGDRRQKLTLENAAPSFSSWPAPERREPKGPDVAIFIPLHKGHVPGSNHSSNKCGAVNLLAVQPLIYFGSSCKRVGDFRAEGPTNRWIA